MTNEEKMLIAIHEALVAFNEGEVPVGAALIKDDIVIASAHNQCIKMRDPTAHAELLVIQKAIKLIDSFKNCSLYVTLEPCAMCAGAIVNSQIENLYFGAFDKAEGCCGSLIDLTDHWLSHSCKTVGGILEEDCASLLTSFFKNKH